MTSYVAIGRHPGITVRKSDLLLFGGLEELEQDAEFRGVPAVEPVEIVGAASGAMAVRSFSFHEFS